ELLQRVAAQLEQPPAPGRDQRTSVAPGPSSPGDSNLAKVLEDLRTTLSAFSTSHAPARASTNEPPPPKNNTALSDLSTPLSTDPKEPTKRHFLWTAKQVLETYGVPDNAMEDPSGMQWYYLTVEGNSIKFKFTTSDLVLKVWMQ